MRSVVKVLGVLVIFFVVAVGGGLLWAKGKSSDLMARTGETHQVDFPVPFPLDSADAAGMTAEEAEAVALERAVERGRHLVQSRYVCVECHGQDFGGGVMVDDPVLGTILGPNITTGEGSRTLDYSPADWDRIVRHGVLKDGRMGAMPSEDFQRMSDQELSDIIAYVRSHEPVDAAVAPPKLGPLGSVLMATGKLPASYELIRDHHGDHALYPPEPEVSVAFGEHLAGVCSGCHRDNLAGGPVVNGDPSWPPAANLTPHADGLADWSYDDFVAAMREGRRPDGSELKYPMTMVAGYTRNMTETEMEAMWEYLRSLPAVATNP